jgi:hypothetical protein
MWFDILAPRHLHPAAKSAGIAKDLGWHMFQHSLASLPAEKGERINVSTFERAEVNGQPGAMFFDTAQRLISVLGLEVQDAKIVAVQVVINPEKLSHLGPLSSLPRLKGPPPNA